MPRRPSSLWRRARKKASDQYYDAKRKNTPHLAAAAKIRNSAQWHKVRDMVLNRNPMCVECEKAGIIEVAKDVDHIVPLAVRPDLAFDLNNLQGLCRYHHNCKTAEER